MRQTKKTQKPRVRKSAERTTKRARSSEKNARYERPPHRIPTPSKESIPTNDEYYMGVAMAVREKANCEGNRIGAAIVKGNRIVSTGYNGVPEGMENCVDGGCLRCKNSGKKFSSGTAYDLCICVHAEQNALLSAARFGIAVEGATIYTTMKPCFGCAKELLQAKVECVVYLHDWSPPDSGDGLFEEKKAEYRRLLTRFPRMRQVPMEDPREEWAVTTKRQKP